MESTASCASLPMQSFAKITLVFKISLSRFATGASEKLAYLPSAAEVGHQDYLCAVVQKILDSRECRPNPGLVRNFPIFRSAER